MIARNEAISLLRKKKNTVPLEDWDGFTESVNDTANYQELANSFQRLPQTYRVVMEMKLLIGCSDGEIASRLGLSKTAVSTRFSWGRRLLRNIVEWEGFLM
ncbi:MAG: sigma-70 family RNA polymerase sigma factor [Oscillospiraceae bacterium]|nr:sigma-70 family RNA polymerase sigma factor [Oscillospiraceae bacterium]